MAQDAEKLAAQAERLRQLKAQARGVTNSDIAQAVGVTERQVQRWLARRNASDIDPQNLKKLARFLGTTADYIEYGRTERPRKGAPALLDQLAPEDSDLASLRAQLDQIQAELRDISHAAREFVAFREEVRDRYTAIDAIVRRMYTSWSGGRVKDASLQDAQAFLDWVAASSEPQSPPARGRRRRAA